MNKKIINYAIKENYIPIMIEDTYKVVKKNKFIDWIIKKFIKCNFIKHFYQEKVEYNVIAIDTEQIMDMIIEQLNNYRIRGEKPKQIIMGREMMYKLQAETNHVVRFNIDLKFREGQKLKLLGLEIVLVPYIDGFVII